MAQQQSTVTISGYVGAEPVSFGRNEHSPACSLRIASTQSYYRNDEQQWHERPTTWMTVKAYRNLASNVLKSVHKGDAIVVYGNLSTESWTKDGNDYNRLILEASTIGHDLTRGTTQFTKHSNQSNSNQTNNTQSYGNNKTESSNSEKSNPQSRTENEEFGGDADI